MKRAFTLVTPANAPALAAHDASELAVLRIKLEGQEAKIKTLREQIAQVEERLRLRGKAS